MKKQTIVTAALLSLIAVPAFAVDCLKQLPGTWEFVAERSASAGDTMGTIEYQKDGSVTMKIPKQNVNMKGTYTVLKKSFKVSMDNHQYEYTIPKCIKGAMLTKRNDGRQDEYRKIK